jgi:iron complex transport system substrate-binding protein
VTACASKDNGSTNGSGSPTPAPSASPSASAAPSAAPAKERTVKDTKGNDVKIPANPQRVIGSYLEDPLLVLGVKPAAQWSIASGGVQEYLKTELQGVPNIPSTLPLENVLSFNPDLMFVASDATVDKGMYEQYSKITPTFVVGEAVTVDWRKTLLLLADVLNKTSVAEKALKDYEEKAKATKAKLQTTIGDKKAAILWLTKKNFYVVNGKVASGAVVYGDLGMKQPNILAVLPEAKANWVAISLEKLAQLDADYIFLVNSDKGQADNLTDPLWKNVPAVKSGNVFEMDINSSWLYNGLIAGSKVMDDLTKALVK